MKVIVHLELSDEERDLFADKIDNKKSKRMASRNDVREFVRGTVDRMLEEDLTPNKGITTPNKGRDGLDLTHHHDDPHLMDKSPSYRRGWNQVKFDRRN